MLCEQFGIGISFFLVFIEKNEKMTFFFSLENSALTKTSRASLVIPGLEEVHGEVPPAIFHQYLFTY